MLIGLSEDFVPAKALRIQGALGGDPKELALSFCSYNISYNEECLIKLA